MSILPMLLAFAAVVAFGLTAIDYSRYDKGLPIGLIFLTILVYIGLFR